MCIGRGPFLGNFLISGSHFLKPATYNREVTQATKGLWNGGLILSKKKYFKVVVKYMTLITLTTIFDPSFLKKQDRRYSDLKVGQQLVFHITKKSRVFKNVQFYQLRYNQILKYKHMVLSEILEYFFCCRTVIMMPTIHFKLKNIYMKYYWTPFQLSILVWK